MTLSWHDNIAIFPLWLFNVCTIVVVVHKAAGLDFIVFFSLCLFVDIVFVFLVRKGCGTWRGAAFYFFFCLHSVCFHCSCMTWRAGGILLFFPCLFVFVFLVREGCRTWRGREPPPPQITWEPQFRLSGKCKKAPRMRHKSGRQLPIPSWQQFMAENCGWLVGHPRPRVSTSRDSQLDPDPDFEYFIYCLLFNTQSWIPIFYCFWSSIIWALLEMKNCGKLQIFWPRKLYIQKLKYKDQICQWYH